MALKHKTVHQVLTFIPVFLGCLFTGMNTGWLAPVLKRSQGSDYHISLTLDQCSWIVALQEPAKTCGVIISMWCVDWFGRKKMLFAASLLNLFGWALIRLIKPTIIIFVSKCAFGMVSGILDITHAIYIGENSSPETRATFITVKLSFIFIGLVSECALATYLAYGTVATINISVSFIAFLTCFLARETVQFLLMKGKYDKAEETYNWLFPENKNELENIKESIRESSKSIKLIEFFRNPACYKGTAIAVISVVMLISTGIMILPQFASMLFGSTTMLTPNEFTICLNLIQMVSALASTIFIERFNRRTILITSLTIAGSAHACSASLYFVHDYITPIPNFPWLIFITISTFSSVSLMGMLPLCEILRAELFPQRIKPIGNALTIFGTSTATFLISATFLKIGRAVGYFANFMLFSTNCWIALLFVHFFVPETKGKSLIEIQNLLLRGKSSLEVEAVQLKEND